MYEIELSKGGRISKMFIVSLFDRMVCVKWVEQSLVILRLEMDTLFQAHVPDSKVHGANMGPIWGQQDPGGPHVGPINFAIWGTTHIR